MSKLSMTTKLAAPADILWRMLGTLQSVGDWRNLSEPIGEKGPRKGATRKIELMGGGSVVERLEHINESERLYLYSITESPFPITNCVIEVRVKDNGDGTSTMEWSSNFVPAGGATETETAKMLESIYQSSVNALKGMFSGRSS